MRVVARAARSRVAGCLAAGAALLTLAFAAVAVSPAQATTSPVTATPTEWSKYVRAAHEDLLDSTASASFDFRWTGALATGTVSRSSFVLAVGASPASTQTQVIRTYEVVLHRAPSPAALDSWSSQIQHHRLTIAKLAALLYASHEWVDGFG